MDEQELLDEAIERGPSTRLAKMYARDGMASFAKDAEGKDQRSKLEKEKNPLKEKEPQDGIASSSTTDTKKNLMHANKEEIIIKCVCGSETTNEEEETLHRGCVLWPLAGFLVLLCFASRMKKMLDITMDP